MDSQVPHDAKAAGPDVVVSRASWVWKGEIFLACILGSYKEGGAQKLNEDEAGGAEGSRFLVPARGKAPVQEGGPGVFSKGRLWGPETD